MIDIAIAGVMLASTHLGAAIPEGHPRNVLTPGAYVVMRNGMTAGVYRNSFDRTSWQLGYTQRWSGRWSWSAGLVTGYPDRGRGRVLPYVAVSYAFGDKAGARIITMPEETGPVALALELR